MPTYEYECRKGHTFEVVQRMTDDPLTRCTQCKSKVQRLISASSFILKGKGWYADGYSKASPSRASSSSESASSGSTSSSSSSESASSGSASAGSDSASSSKSSSD